MESLDCCLGDRYLSLPKDKHALNTYREMGALLGVNILKKKVDVVLP